MRTSPSEEVDIHLNQAFSIVEPFRSRRMRWAGHVARMGEKRNAYRILVGKPEGKNHWEDQDVCGWTILKWILER
jgi:hypothetical protein